MIKDLFDSNARNMHRICSSKYAVLYLSNYQPIIHSNFVSYSFPNNRSPPSGQDIRIPLTPTSAPIMPRSNLLTLPTSAPTRRVAPTSAVATCPTPPDSAPFLVLKHFYQLP